MNKEKTVTIPVLEVHQNIGTFFVGVAKARDVKKICYAEARRVNEDDLEKYIGMQRPLFKSRVKEIQEYVKTNDATFPNSIILALNSDSFEVIDGMVYIKKDKGSANILDGQHRLAGFFEDNDEKDFELIVTLFPDLSLEDQAYLFSVINTKQNKINPSLAQDLYDFAKLETPQKIAHNIVVEFNNSDVSPWQNLIKRLGVKGPHGTEILSQSTFSKGIINLLCNSKDSYTIRSILKMNKNNRNSLKNKFNYKPDTRIFWEPYLDKRDDFIYQVLKSFFQAVRDNFNVEWGDSRYILTKTTGYSALLKVFRILYLKGFQDKDLTYNFFSSYLSKAKTSGKLSGITSENYNPGTTGENKLYRDFLSGMEVRD